MIAAWDSYDCMQVPKKKAQTSSSSNEEEDDELDFEEAGGGARSSKGRRVKKQRVIAVTVSIGSSSAEVILSAGCRPPVEVRVAELRDQ